MSDSRLYSRLLFPQGHGYPLFRPQPSDDLPEPARRTGTEIGEVGVVTEDGCFDPIFNILRAADDRANRFGVPMGFEQLVLGPEDIRVRTLFHLAGSGISNTKIKKRRLDVDAGIEDNVFVPLGAGAVVEVSTNSKETGLLMLPDGASRWDLRPHQVFRDYAIKHAQSWYMFVNGPLGRMVGNGDLYLITGVTKSTSWSVAAISNSSGDGKVSLKLKAAQVGAAGASCAWEWEHSSSSVDSGPRRHPGQESWRDNQTVFLRGYKVALRSMPLRRAPKVVSIATSKGSNVLSKSTSVPFSQTRSIPGPSNNLSRNAPRASGSDSASDSDESMVDYSPKLYHPSDVINDYLLDSLSGKNAMVAVAHDDDWASVLEETEDELPEPHEFIRRISSKFGIGLTAEGVCLVSRVVDAPPPYPTIPGLPPTSNRGRFPRDARVFYWNGAGQAIYGTVQRTAREANDSFAVEIKLDLTGEVITLPASSVTKAA